MLDFPKIVVIEQDPSLPYGNGSPIASAHKFVETEEAFLVLYSDDVVFGNPGDAKVMVDTYLEDPGIAGVIMAQEVSPDVVDKYGIISFKEGTDDELDNIIEKPEKEGAPSHLASYGRYLVKQDVFTYLNPQNTGKDGELWTVDAITSIAKTKKIKVVRTKGEWMTTGDPENYFIAHLRFVVEHTKYGKNVREWLEKNVG